MQDQNAQGCKGHESIAKGDTGRDSKWIGLGLKGQRLQVGNILL